MAAAARRWGPGSTPWPTWWRFARGHQNPLAATRSSLSPPGQVPAPKNTVQAIQESRQEPDDVTGGSVRTGKDRRHLFAEPGGTGTRLDDRPPLHRHRPVLVRAYRHRRQRRRLVQQQLGAGYGQPEPSNQRAQPRWRTHPRRPDQRRRGERRAWGTAIAQDGSTWFGNVAKGAFSTSEYSSTGSPLSASTGWTHGALDFSPRRRRRPEGQHLDRQQLRARERSGPGRRRGQPRGQPGEGHHYHRGRAQPPLRHPNRRAGQCLGLQRRPGRGQLVGTKLAPLIGKFSGSVTVIGPNFKPTAYSPIQSSSFRFPLGIALDSHGNAWVISYLTTP